MKINGRKTYKAGPRDECGSPPHAVVPILNTIEWYRKQEGIRRYDFVIWEPATGLVQARPLTGLVRGFQAVGYRIFAPLMVDFTTTTFEEANRSSINNLGSPISMIATNPPFSVALKRKFINHCDDIYQRYNIPYALLMNTTTLVEKINGDTLRQCAVHIPYGRICFDMPNKGWGTKEKPTKPTFTTNWFTKGLTDPYGINYDTSKFNMSDYFKAEEAFEDYVHQFNKDAEYLDYQIRYGSVC